MQLGATTTELRRPLRGAPVRRCFLVVPRDARSFKTSTDKGARRGAERHCGRVSHPDIT